MMFVGKKISKKVSSNTWKKGTVIRIINMEGLNTMYHVEWDDGSLENLRLYEDYLNDDIWMEEEQKNMASFMADLLMGKLRGKLMKRSDPVVPVEEKPTVDP